jgi:hypothetical protein
MSSDDISSATPLFSDREDDYVLFELNIDAASGRVYAQRDVERKLWL